MGSYRRTATPQPNASFFDTSNKEGERLRKAAAEAAVNDMCNWFRASGNVIGILDATNSTKSRRRWIKDRCDAEGIETLFVESKCDEEDLIMSNILEVKTTSPDYQGQDPEEAAKDFRERIKMYEAVYQTLDEDEADMTYCKLIDVGSQVIINRISDYLQSRVIYYLMNLHIKPRSIWISRVSRLWSKMRSEIDNNSQHGESMYNVSGQIGGDADLSSRGQRYAKELPRLVKNSAGSLPLTVWISTLKRTAQTAAHLPYEKLSWKALDELDSGVCDGLTYAEIEQEFPQDFKARDEDKYNYRYLGGESYRDVVIRLEPIIMELERSENILIVTHQAVLRCIYAYFMGSSQDKSPWMEVPLHCLIKLTPRAYKTEEERYFADVPAVSTWREKGSKAVHQDTPESSRRASPKIEITGEVEKS